MVRKLTRKNRIRILAAEKGVTIAQLAKELDMLPHTLRRYTRHEAEPRLELADKIAAYFNVHRDDVLGSNGETMPIPQMRNGDNVPVYGAAAGGPGFDVTDVTEPVDHIARPHYLQNAKGGYGVYVVGDSMEPRFYSGETVIVHTGKPVRKGDWCVVQLRAGDAVHAVVKQFHSSTASKVTLRQLNPASDLKFDSDDVIAIHKVVGVELG